MKTPHTSQATEPSTAAWGRGLFVVAAMCLAACGKSASTAEAGSGDTPLEAGDTAGTADSRIAGIAQVSDAAAAMDLSRLSLPPGAERPAEQTVTSLAYRCASTPEEAFKFHRQQLQNSGWKEQAGTSVTPQYASGMYGKHGLHLSLVAMPDQPGKVSVNLRHHGNVNLGTLPVPGGAKSIYAGPSSAIFSVDLPPDAAARETAVALGKTGWAPYGSAGNTQWFKQNAVKLSVLTGAAPAQAGKTTINFTSEMLPADIPVPATAADVQFDNARKRLTFRVGLSHEECLGYYRETLAKSGWKSTMDAPAKIEGDQVLIFRSTAGDILRLGMRAGNEGKLSVFAEHMSAADIQEMNRKLDAQAAAHKASKAATK